MEVLLPVRPFGDDVQRSQRPCIVPAVIFQLGIQHHGKGITIVEDVAIPNHRTAVRIADELVRPRNHRPVFLSVGSLAEIGLHTRVVVFRLTFVQQFKVLVAIVQILHSRIRRHGRLGIGIDRTVGEGEVGRKSPGLVFIAAVVEREYYLVRILIVRTVAIEDLGIISQQPVVAGLDSDGSKRLFGHCQIVVAALLHRIHP